MGRGLSLRAQDVDDIRRELGPVIIRLNQLAALHGITVSTLVKHCVLPDPINVRPVPVSGLDDWNEHIWRFG